MAAEEAEEASLIAKNTQLNKQASQQSNEVRDTRTHTRRQTDRRKQSLHTTGRVG